MRLLVNFILLLMLFGCYYDPKTGCIQHFNYVDCPFIDLRLLYKEGENIDEKNIDLRDCISKTNSEETRYQCMESKGYKRIR